MTSLIISWLFSSSFFFFELLHCESVNDQIMTQHSPTLTPVVSIGLSYKLSTCISTGAACRLFKNDPCTRGPWEWTSLGVRVVCGVCVCVEWMLICRLELEINMKWNSSKTVKTACFQRTERVTAPQSDNRHSVLDGYQISFELWFADLISGLESSSWALSLSLSLSLAHFLPWADKSLFFAKPDLIP